MAKHQITDLGHLEREVIEIVWKHSGVSADTVQKKLARLLKESTVRTVLKRLEEKGYLSHTIENRTFIYRARESRPAAAARAIKAIIDRFCNGSVEEVLLGMVETRFLNQRDVNRIVEKVAKEKAKTGSK